VQTRIAAARRAALAVLLILAVPVAVRVPAWLLGLSDDPVWFTSVLALPGGQRLLDGLPGFLDPNAGWTTEALGGAAAHQWLQGRVPWWDPFSGIGMPLAAEMQSSALFLPYVLLLALPRGVALLTISLQQTAGLATWRLLARLGMSRRAALTGALAFELCACFAWMGAPLNLPMAFLPLFLLGVERARAAAIAGRGGGWRITALAVALSLYAGFPEAAYLDGLLALLWAAVRGAGSPGRRLGFAVRVAAGGLVGLLLAAPLLWLFLDLLRGASVGERQSLDMAALSLPREGLVQLLMPYALGLPAALSPIDPTGELLWLWGRAGGFLGLPLALAALTGAVTPGPHRALRAAIGIWTALLLARIAGAPPAMRLFDVVPFNSQMQVFRYASAAWLLPCCILAAHAVERPPPHLLVRLAAAVLLAAGAAAAWLCWPLVRVVPTAPAYLAASAAWALLTLAAAAFGAGEPRRASAILLADMAALFVVTTAAGWRHAALDTPAIDFLRQNLGLQRFATLGTFQANYGALFGAASVNYNYLPAPALWAGYVEAHLRPGASPVRFTGNMPVDAPGRPSNAQILADHLRDYAGVGVRYVLASGWSDPFAPPPEADGPREAYRLDAGMTLSGKLDASRSPVRAITVLVGTYAGRSSGALELELCADVCAHGEADLASASDNEPLELRLDRALPAGAPLTWTLRHRDGEPVAIWRTPGPEGPQPVLATLASDAPRRVYADPIMTIYEIADPAPYFSALGGPCELAPRGREEVDASCEAPATLIRRELAMPGWSAQVNGAAVAPETSGEVFQSVPLPQGRSHAAFRYIPPGAPFWLPMFILGAAGLLPWHRAPALRRRTG
jgi:hypothetical protein